MKIVILDGFAANPGDISWEGLKALGECTIYDRTAPEEVLERSAGAEVILTNKVIINADHMAALPELKYIGVLATGYNVVDTAAAKEPVQEELCQIDTIPPGRFSWQQPCAGCCRFHRASDAPHCTVFQ